ncbi:MAG: metal ABC transporter ATP-binding protein [Pseudomonadota bacterium]|nr:metal ABC transporter ATP-binding protein [Pseudomonadota bacterium]
MQKQRRPVVKGASLIAAKALRVARRGKVILDHVDIAVAPGEIVTVIGPNGAGKTTLVRTLLGLTKADSGSVERREGLRIGYLPQRLTGDPTIPMTVTRFVALSRKLPAGRTAEALNEVGAGHLGGAQLSDLSGGELQRVALAKALAGDPDLLVLDEPVQNVDYAGERALYALIGEIRSRRGCGILLVSHDLHVVLGSSDRVVCLNQHVCCSGVPESVARHPEYARLFGDDAARVYGVYEHRHDHEHDLSGEVAGHAHSHAHGHDHD